MSTIEKSPSNSSNIAGTLYFAYGSNISPTQMALRCISAPSSSSPAAIACLRGWKWYICMRGCANIVYTGSPNHGEDEVWGVIYRISGEDEKTLDHWEGVNGHAPAAASGREMRWGDAERPAEQGTKMYLEAEVMESKLMKSKERSSEQGPALMRVLVYVDERNIEKGTIRPSYMGRMNRGLREAVELGLSKEWVEKVVRPLVPEGVEAPEGYVGEYNK